MTIHQEKIEPLPALLPIPADDEPADVLSLWRTTESLRQENIWLKAQFARMVRGE